MPSLPYSSHFQRGNARVLQLATAPKLVVIPAGTGTRPQQTAKQCRGAWVRALGAQAGKQLLPVELYEHQVPDLQDIGVILIDQVRGIPVPNPVIVDLTARAAGARVSHFPEVILHIARQNPALRQPGTRNSC